MIVVSDALNMETRAFLSHCDSIKKQISTHAKQTIDLIKQQAKRLSSDLDQMIAEQLEYDRVVFLTRKTIVHPFDASDLQKQFYFVSKKQKMKFFISFDRHSRVSTGQPIFE